MCQTGYFLIYLTKPVIQAKIKLIKNITVTSIHLTYFYTAFICRVSLDNINTACLPVTYKLTSSCKFFVLLFTGFEQHFPVRVNDTFKRDFLYKIIRDFLHMIDRVHLFSVRISISRTKPFRNRSSSFGVGPPRLACAIVRVFMTNIFASHITDSVRKSLRAKATRSG